MNFLLLFNCLFVLLNEIVMFNMVSDFRNLVVAIESFNIIELRLSEIH